MGEEYENSARTTNPGGAQGREALTEEFLAQREVIPQGQSGEGLGLPVVNFNEGGEGHQDKAPQQKDANQEQPPAATLELPGEGTSAPSDERAITDERTLPGGTKFKKYDDGTQRFEYTDGTAYEKHADHEKHFNKNGDVIENYDNGKTKVVYKNGNIVTTTTDGDVQLEKPDGETLLWRKDGMVVRTMNGESTTWESDGSVNQQFNDASAISWDKNGDITVSLNDDGTRTTFRSDGTVSHLQTEDYEEEINGKEVSMGIKFTKVDELPDGSVRISSGFESTDGVITETDPLLLKRSDEPDGTAVLRNDEGSIEMRRSTNGAVQQIVRDGPNSMETTFHPNGELMHREGNFTIQRFVDGTVELQNTPDTEAKSIRVHPSGTTNYVYEDGTHRTVDVNGRVTTIGPDGKMQNSRIEVESPDGKILHPDFSGDDVKVNLPDGTIGTIEKDGDDYILVNPDGTKNRLFVDNANAALFDDVLIAKNAAELSRAKVPPKAVQIMGRIP